MADMSNVIMGESFSYIHDHIEIIGHGISWLADLCLWKSVMLWLS